MKVIRNIPNSPLIVHTGEFTGRSPKDRYFVDHEKSNDKKDKMLKDWIASNARLWVDLVKQQQAEILAGGIAEAKKQWGSNPRYRR